MSEPELARARGAKEGAAARPKSPPVTWFGRLARSAGRLLPGARSDYEKMMSAVREGALDEVREWLPKTGAWSHSSCSLTPLAWAAQAGMTEMVKLLLPASDPARSKRGSALSALHYAAMHGRAGCVEALLPHCDPRITDERGKDALMMAALDGSAECVKALLPHTDPLARDETGRSALGWAARRGNAEAAAALIGVSELNAQDENGWTPLMEASAAGSVECVRLLLAVADVSVLNRQGKRAAQLALGAAREEIAELISGWGSAMQERRALDQASGAPAAARAPRASRL